MNIKNFNKTQITILTFQILWILVCLYRYLFLEIPYKMPDWLDPNGEYTFNGINIIFIYYYYVAPILHSLIFTAFCLYIFDSRRHINMLIKIFYVIIYIVGYYFFMYFTHGF